MKRAGDDEAPAGDVATFGPGPYRINVAAELSGVPAATLRAWERRYGVPTPRRTSSAYRLYTSGEVRRVARMRGLIEAGVAPAEAARLVLSSGSAEVAAEAPATDGLDLAREKLLAAAYRWDSEAIDAELTRLSYLVDPHALYARVVSPLLVEVGRRWEEGTLSIAQEHLLTEKLELVLRAALRAVERAEGPLVLLACVDADDHVLGLLGAALQFASVGAKVTVLGASTPPAAIADAVRSLRPRIVGLSVTRPPADPTTLFQKYADACGATRWLVGGAAADAVRGVVERAGGSVVVGTTDAWGVRVRDWLRGER